MGKDYPVESGGYNKFRRELKKNFQSTPVTTEQELNNALKKGDYIIKELETLYFLKKYRYLKRQYTID